MKSSKEIKFETKIQYDVEYEPLSKFTNVEHFENGSDMFVINVNEKTIKTGFYKNNTSSNHQAIVSKEHLDAILAEPEDLRNLNSKFKYKTSIELVDKNYTAYLSEIGFRCSILEKINKDKKEPAKPDNVWDNANDSAYEFVEMMDRDSGLCKDSRGNMFMSPIRFDYINGTFDNEKYHLDELVEHLSKRDDIAFITDENNSFKAKLIKAPFTGKEKDLNKIISEIPYYNASEGRTESICVIYYPKTKDLLKIMAWNMKDPSFSQELRSRLYDEKQFIASQIFSADQFQKSFVVVQESKKRKYKS